MSLMTSPISRRSLLAGGASLATGRLLSQSDPPVRASRSLRFAHLTDLHIQPELAADAGVAACVRHVQALPDAPSLIITGGDLIMDAFAQPRDRVQLQFDLLDSVFRRECSVPTRHCIGNHDIWGWNLTKSGTTGTERSWGKVWACDLLRLDRAFYSFDQAGWRFIVLDSVQPSDGGYLGGLDEPQFEWLASELRSNPSAPTIIVSHIPILSLVALLADGKLESNTFRLSAASVMKDGAKVHSLLRAHPQVKLCISGHIHKLERIELDGITYICNGAVSGAWWAGPKDRCAEGYGLFDLYADGSHTYAYTPFGWDARAAAGGS